MKWTWAYHKLITIRYKIKFPLSCHTAVAMMVSHGFITSYCTVDNFLLMEWFGGFD